MKRSDFSAWNCSIARTSDLIGDAWTPLILRDAAGGISRFDGFQTSLGISRNTLTQRLDRLVLEGMLIKTAYCETPKRYDYTLTEKGADFIPVLFAMAAWGDKWMFNNVPPFIVKHDLCGQDLKVNIVCECCKKTVCLQDLRPA